MTSTGKTECDSDLCLDHRAETGNPHRDCPDCLGVGSVECEECGGEGGDLVPHYDCGGFGCGGCRNGVVWVDCPICPDEPN